MTQHPPRPHPRVPAFRHAPDLGSGACQPTAGMTRRGALLAGAAAALAAAVPARARAAQTVTRIAGDLDEPWAIAFLPGDPVAPPVLVTERGGRLWRIADGRRTAVSGLPEVAVGGQGGLFDLLIPRDFRRTREVILTFARPQGAGAGTALASARLSQDGTRLEAMRLLFEVAPGSRGGRHFGGRVVELPDGTLAMTSGDRGTDDLAQDLGRHEGKVIRVNRDGSVPADNPFRATDGARPEIWTLGHRNPQGAALDAQGRLWVSEHGARGGDEVNLIRRGANYGWPVISYGRHYSGRRIGIGTEAPGLEQPAHYWDPSIAPSGHLVHSGRMFADWRGAHLVGSLKLDHIAVLAAGSLAETRIDLPETARVRDLREAPDGAVWFLSVRRSAIFRMAR